MTPFPLGFRQLPDERDARYPLSDLMAGAGKRPVSKKWLPGEVLDQGRTSSCVGHACWQLLASEPTMCLSNLSPYDIYGEARKIDEFPGDADTGTSVRAGLNVLRNHGGIRAYYWAQGIDDAVEYLLKLGPLVLGIRWADSMFSPDAKGVIHPVGRGGGGHAIFAYAADWKGKFVTLRNSWNATWGKRGDCKISFTDLDKLLREGGVAAAVEE